MNFFTLGQVNCPMSATTSTTTSTSLSAPRRARNWMVALDDSIESEWAFWTAVNDMEKEKDTLHLISVTSKKLQEEETSRTILLPFTEKARQAQVRNVCMILGLSKDIGYKLRKAAMEYCIDILVIGHKREVNWVTRCETVGMSNYLD